MNAIKRILPVCCLALFFAGSPVKDGYEVGDVVASFTLKNIDGKMVALSDYKGEKGVIVIFDSNTCPVSKAYNERILSLNQMYTSKGFPIVVINANDAGISPGDSFDEMVKHASNKGYKFPYLIDESQEVAHAFGATNTPHVFVLQNNAGKFTVAYIGAIDNNSSDASSADKKYVQDAVDALLGGKEVPVKKTKAIGCTIKYRNT